MIDGGTVTQADDNFFFDQPKGRRWLRGVPSGVSPAVSLGAKRRQNTSMGDQGVHRRLGDQGFPLMRSEEQTLRRLCRELVAVLGEISADAVKPIRDRPGRAHRAQGRSGAASEPSRDGIAVVGWVGRSGHCSGDLPAHRLQRRRELAEARLAILLCNFTVPRPRLGHARRWTRDAILGALCSPPPKRNT